jgi:hypothetical protein
MSDVIPANGSALLSFIERAARDETFDINKFEALLRMQREVAHEQAQQAFNAAMARVEAEIGPVLRDRLNPAVNRKYATLEAIDAAARPVYSRHGFSVRFGCDKPPKEGWMRITCTVSHVGGYSEQNYLDSPVDIQHGARARTPVQAVGSTITYLRRYLLQMSMNIVLADDETDDDGEPSRAAADARAEINREVPMAKPQAAPQTGRTDEQWQSWVLKLRAACGALYHRDEIVEIGNRPSVGDAIATGPEWVRAEVSSILAENYARLPADDLPEVEIAGSDKLAAG